MTEPWIAFRVREHDEPALEVRVNFGVFAGRNATQAEIDDLAHALHGVAPSFTIVAEDRHEFGDAVEAAVRQIVIAVEREHVSGDVDDLCEEVVARAERWAAAAIGSRADLGELAGEY